MSQMVTLRQPETLTEPPKMTYEEFLEWADEDTHAEWVDGEVVFMSPVSNVHQDIGLFLISCLTFYVQERQLGRIFYAEFQMKLGSGLPGRQPDVLFVSAANLSRLRRNYLDGPADIAVEIISPESVERDRVQKFAEYQQGGVGEYWLIDPLERTVQFYQRNAGGRFVLVPLDENGIYFCRVLEGFWLKVDWLWQSPLPTLRTVLEEWGVM